MTAREKARMKYQSMHRAKGLGALFAMFENRPKLWILALAIYDFTCMMLAKQGSLRMWMVHPKGMCTGHLQKEHDDCHALARLVTDRDPSLRGYILLGWVETHKIVQRHDELSRERLSRGRIPCDSTLTIPHEFGGFVDIVVSHRDLHSSCNKCYRRYLTVWNEYRKPKVKYAQARL